MLSRANFNLALSCSCVCFHEVLFCAPLHFVFSELGLPQWRAIMYRKMGRFIAMPSCFLAREEIASSSQASLRSIPRILATLSLPRGSNGVDRISLLLRTRYGLPHGSWSKAAQNPFQHSSLLRSIVFFRDLR
jgi:hypothetical protein